MFWIMIGQILIIVGVSCFATGIGIELNKRYEIPKGKVMGVQADNYIVGGETKLTLLRPIIIDAKDKNKIFPDINTQMQFELKEHREVK